MQNLLRFSIQNDSLLTRMQSSVLLDVTELFKPSITVGTFVWLLASVDPNMLHQLMVAAERFQALLTLVRLDFASSRQLPGVHLHR